MSTPLSFWLSEESNYGAHPAGNECDQDFGAGLVKYTHPPTHPHTDTQPHTLSFSLFGAGFERAKKRAKERVRAKGGGRERERERAKERERERAREGGRGGAERGGAKPAIEISAPASSSLTTTPAVTFVSVNLRLQSLVGPYIEINNQEENMPSVRGAGECNPTPKPWVTLHSKP